MCYIFVLFLCDLLFLYILSQVEFGLKIFVSMFSTMHLI
jgi:hypothetical protein